MAARAHGARTPCPAPRAPPPPSPEFRPALTAARLVHLADLMFTATRFADGDTETQEARAE